MEECCFSQGVSRKLRPRKHRPQTQKFHEQAIPRGSEFLTCRETQTHNNPSRTGFSRGSEFSTCRKPRPIRIRVNRLFPRLSFQPSTAISGHFIHSLHVVVVHNLSPVTSAISIYSRDIQSVQFSFNMGIRATIFTPPYSP